MDTIILPRFDSSMKRKERNILISEKQGSGTSKQLLIQCEMSKVTD